MGAIWSDARRRCELLTRQKKQTAVLEEVKLMETCVGCYLDHRLKLLLSPYRKGEHPWDMLPHRWTLLSYFRNIDRNNNEYKEKQCNHCQKGPLENHVSGLVLDILCNRQTQRCQCGTLTEESDEESDISLGQISDYESDYETGFEDDYSSHPEEDDLSSKFSANFNLSTPELTSTDESDTESNAT